jgi:hypothetical protein
VADRTPSQRGAANRRRGNLAELAVAKYLRTVGFPHAERAVRTGYRTPTRTSPDPGDIAGVPGLVVSVKDAKTEQLTSWLTEVRVMTAAGGELGLLVHKRRGHADPARWWCWLALGDLMRITTDAHPCQIRAAARDTTTPVRMELGHVVPLLHAAGYGTPPATAETP